MSCKACGMLRQCATCGMLAACGIVVCYTSVQHVVLWYAAPVCNMCIHRVLCACFSLTHSSCVVHVYALICDLRQYYGLDSDRVGHVLAVALCCAYVLTQAHPTMPCMLLVIINMTYHNSCVCTILSKLT